MGNSAPSAPSPTAAAGGQLAAEVGQYPFQDIINELAQTGGDQTLVNPATGQPENYNFTDLGTADVQNAVSSQMAQTLLNIQQNLGPQYTQLALQNLQQSDPTGYSAYQQLFDKIQQEAAQNPPDQPLSEATQAQINNLLQNSNTLTPTEQTQAEQQANAGNVASGIVLGNAPEQAVASNVVGATDQQTNQAQAAAQQYLSEGVSPADIAFRTLQQNLANEGSFVSGQNPTAEFSSLSGASNGAAPTTIPTDYSSPSINESQAAGQGVSLANNLFGSQAELANAQANPYLAGLNFAIQGLSTGLNANPNPFSEFSGVSSPTAATNSNALMEYYGLGTPAMTGSGATSNVLPAEESTADYSDFS